MLLLLYYLIQLLVSVIPFAGPLAMMVLPPGVHRRLPRRGVDAGARRQPEIRHLFRGFRANLWALLPLGVVLIVGTTLAVLATALVDGGVLLDALTSNAKPDEALAANARVEARDAVRHRRARCPRCSRCGSRRRWSCSRTAGRGRRCATSLRAALANWRPVAVYGLLLFFCGARAAGNRHRARSRSWCRRSPRRT